MNNIIYWVPSLEKPTGGIKIIYQHCLRLNEMGINASVFHWENLDYKYFWDEFNIPFKQEWNFNAETDLSIIPEMYASRIGGYLKQNNLKYGIFVQNQSLALFDGLYTSPESVRDSYRLASLVLTISDETTNYVKSIFTEITNDKIIQLVPSVTGCYVGKKNKLITCMPRKLMFHGQIIEQLSQQILPKDWEFLHLDSPC